MRTERKQTRSLWGPPILSNLAPALVVFNPPWSSSCLPGDRPFVPPLRSRLPLSVRLRIFIVLLALLFAIDTASLSSFLAFCHRLLDHYRCLHTMSAGSSGAAKQRGSKPKGAVRAKSGCYTCRIRRKKCDEKMNNEGSCQTCERLRLQCLGFGAKRPDWMREGNSVAEIREKIKTFLAQNGMIKGHSGTANLRSVGPLTPTQDPSGSADAMSPSSSSLPLSQSAAGPGTNSLSTPLSATSTLTPDDRSASPNSPPNSRMHHSHFAGDRTFPPSHVHPQDHYDHSLDASGIHRGGHGTGILDLSNGRPTPIRSQSMRTARHSGYGNSFGEATSGLGLISMGPLTTTNGNEPSNTNNHTRRSLLAHLRCRRTADLLGCEPRTSETLPFARAYSMTAISAPSMNTVTQSHAPPTPSSVPSHFLTARMASSFSARASRPTLYPHTTSTTANLISNMMYMSSPQLGSTSSTSSSPPMAFRDTPFTPYTPQPVLPTLPSNDIKPSDDLDSPFPMFAFSSTPLSMPTPASDAPLLSPCLDAGTFGSGTDVMDIYRGSRQHSSGSGTNNNTGTYTSTGIRVKIESDVDGFNIDHNYTAHDSNTYVHNSNGITDVLRPRSSIDAGYAATSSNAFTTDDSGSILNESHATSSSYPMDIYDHTNDYANNYAHNSRPSIAHAFHDFTASTSMGMRDHPTYAARVITVDSPYTHHIPQLSPDSPKPSRPADPMIGAYTSHSAQVAGPGYVSTGHHVTEEFSVNSGHMRPGGVGHAGIASGQTDHGYGHSNAYGPNQTAPSSSFFPIFYVVLYIGGSPDSIGSEYGLAVAIAKISPYPAHSYRLVALIIVALGAGDDTVRSATHQSQEHAMHQHQATYGWPPTGFPNTPAVPRNDLPPPSMQSSFGASYNFTNYAMDLAMNEADAFNAQQAPMTSMAVSGVDEGSMIPYYPTAPVTEVDFYVLPQEEQQRIYQDMAPLQVLQPALMDPLFADRADRSLVEHYLRHVRPVQYFFWEDRVADLLRGLAFSNEAVRNAICSVASVHIRRMREGSIQLRERTPLSPSRRLPLLLATDIPNVPEGDDGNTYYDRTQLVLRQTGPERLTEAEAMAGLQCISSFLFAGGVGGWDFFLDVACTWVDMVFKRFRHLAGDAYLLEELTKMKRESELMSFIIRTTMWFEVLASVTMVRKPKFLEVYQVLFADSARIVEADGQATRTEAEFSMLEVMGCDNLTFLALAEISALAAWKEEQIKNQTLSFVELQERKSKIEDHCLRALAEAEASIFRDGSALGTDSLKNRRRLTADIFRASARLYLHTVLSGDNPGVKEIRDGARDTIDALKRVPPEPKSLRCSVVRSVVFPLCLAGCMTDVATERATVKEFLEGEGGAGNCGSVVAVMETVWERRDAKRRGGRRTEEVAGNVSWRDVLRERGGGMPILLV
ncbi:hypothetical protein ACEPAH_7978 [Sanghuangporus vaninii]